MKGGCLAAKGEALCLRAKTQDDFKLAVATLEEALRLDPENATLWIWLSDALRGAGRPLDGLEACRYSTTIEPENENHEWRWQKAGEALRDLGRGEEAQVAFAKSQAIAAETQAWMNNVEARDE